MKTLAALTFALFLTGCTALSSYEGDSFLVQYSTLKLIEESETVDADVVFDATERLRDRVESDDPVSVVILENLFRAEYDFSSLPASDRLLVNSLVSRIQGIIASRLDVGEERLDDNQKTVILQLLTEVEEAASLYK